MSSSLRFYLQIVAYIINLEINFIVQWIIFLIFEFIEFLQKKLEWIHKKSDSSKGGIILNLNKIRFCDILNIRYKIILILHFMPVIRVVLIALIAQFQSKSRCVILPVIFPK